MADTQSILQLGIEAARAGDKAEARELFRLVTREDPGSAQGWLWLAGVAEDREEKRAALERVIQLEPGNDLARKGLAALGGARAAVPATETPAAPPAAPATPVEAPAAPDTPAPRAGRARIYDQPQQVGGYVPPAESDEDYDLGEYQSRPTPAADDFDRDDTVVVVEDEEPRRGFAAFWPLLLLGLLVLGVLLFFLLRSFLGTDPSVATDPGASVVAEGSAPAASPIAEASVPAAAASPGTDATGLLTPSPAGSVASAASPDAASSPEAAASAEPAPSVAASPSVEAAASVPASPSVEASPSPAAEASPAAPEASPPAPSVEAQPPAASAAAPPVDIASANPAIVPNDQVLSAGNWEYSYSGLSNVATGSYGGSPPARGRYLIVLMTVRNVGGAVAQIPDGFFVVKDAQGRVSDFNRQASVDYINRFGGTGPRGAGDYSADSQIAPNAPLGSVPLLFDVAADATDLVVFARDNPAQGFLARQDAR